MPFVLGRSYCSYIETNKNIVADEAAKKCMYTEPRLRYKSLQVKQRLLMHSSKGGARNYGYVQKYTLCALQPFISIKELTRINFIDFLCLFC